MRRMNKPNRSLTALSFATFAAALLLTARPLRAEERPKDEVDLAVIHRIKAEAFRSGKVMDHLFWLTDANGPRLTGSPGFQTAADWAVKALQGFGAKGAQQEKWGRFGRSWSLQHFSAALVAPSYSPLIGMPQAWSGATKGLQTAEVYYAPLRTREEAQDWHDLDKRAAQIQRFIAAHKGKLRGKIVLLRELREFETPTRMAVERLDDLKLAKLGPAPEILVPVELEWPLRRLPSDPKKRAALLQNVPLEVMADYWNRMHAVNDPLWTFLNDEGAVAAFTTDDRGDGALVFVEAAGGVHVGAPVPPPIVTLAPESYGRLVRLADKHVPVKIELDVRSQIHDDVDGINVVAELPGGKKKDEVVMLGAHLDSWHAGTGAADNAAGSAVMIEAFRILKALDLKLDRTVRIALWSGEEQGLYGSRNYVKNHFGDAVTMSLKPAHAKLAGYFNVDNGSGKIRGVYLQGNDMVRPIFEKWLQPFKDLGATTITIRNTGGTDHLPFDGLGLPGFQFIQDPLDYETRTHHSHLDVADHIEPGDLMQAAAIVASFVYNTANRPTLLPRKPLPPPLPARKETVAERQ